MPSIKSAAPNSIDDGGNGVELSDKEAVPGSERQEGLSQTENTGTSVKDRDPVKPAPINVAFASNSDESLRPVKSMVTSKVTSEFAGIVPSMIGKDVSITGVPAGPLS